MVVCNIFTLTCPLGHPEQFDCQCSFSNITSRQLFWGKVPPSPLSCEKRNSFLCLAKASLWLSKSTCESDVWFSSLLSSHLGNFLSSWDINYFSLLLPGSCWSWIFFNFYFYFFSIYIVIFSGEKVETEQLVCTINCICHSSLQHYYYLQWIYIYI